MIDELMAQPDYTSVAKTFEKEQNFIKENVHASGHFGVGGVLGTMGNAAESPGGKLLYNVHEVFTVLTHIRPPLLLPPRQH